MEEPVHSVEDTPVRVAAITPVVPFPVDKTVVHKIKKNPCASQVQVSEWSPITVDYTKLHKHYLKLSKIRLTCKYVIYIPVISICYSEL